MSRKKTCLYLILVLLSSWAIGLMRGTFFITPKKGNASFGQEVYPLAFEQRAETREAIEAPPLAKLGKGPLSINLVAPGIVCSRPEDAIPHTLSGADACYLLMSLQR